MEDDRIPASPTAEFEVHFDEGGFDSAGRKRRHRQCRERAECGLANAIHNATASASPKFSSGRIADRALKGGPA